MCLEIVYVIALGHIIYKLSEQLKTYLYKYLMKLFKSVDWFCILNLSLL